jgi:hypothetical protein
MTTLSGVLLQQRVLLPCVGTQPGLLRAAELLGTRISIVSNKRHIHA